MFAALAALVVLFSTSDAMAVTNVSLGPISAEAPNLRLYAATVAELRGGFDVTVMLEGDPVRRNTTCALAASGKTATCSGLGSLPATVYAVSSGVVVDLDLRAYLPAKAEEAGSATSPYVHWEKGWLSWITGPTCVLDEDDQAQCEARIARDPILNDVCMGVGAEAQVQGGQCVLVCICDGAGAGILETEPIETASPL